VAALCSWAQGGGGAGAQVTHPRLADPGSRGRAVGLYYTHKELARSCGRDPRGILGSARPPFASVLRGRPVRVIVFLTLERSASP